MYPGATRTEPRARLPGSLLDLCRGYPIGLDGLLCRSGVMSKDPFAAGC